MEASEQTLGKVDAQMTGTLSWVDEKPQLSTSFNSKASETVVAYENESKVDVNVDTEPEICKQDDVQVTFCQPEESDILDETNIKASVRYIFMF